METYSKWADVPEHLKTKTGLNQAGLRRRPKQGAVAQIDTRWGKHGGVYDLYDIRECLQATPISDAERQARRDRMKTMFGHCLRCWQRRRLIQGLCADCNDDRNAIAQWARHMINHGAVVVDTETTGLTPGNIVEIAIIDITGATLLNTLVNPGRHIPEDVTLIHGITDAMVANAPTFSAICEQVTDLLSQQPTVIYNAEFDTAFLRAEGVSVYEPYCLMRKFAVWHGDRRNRHDYKWQTLATACQIMNIERTAQHRAHADASDTLKLLRAIAQP